MFKRGRFIKIVLITKTIKTGVKVLKTWGGDLSDLNEEEMGYRPMTKQELILKISANLQRHENMFKGYSKGSINLKCACDNLATYLVTEFANESLRTYFEISWVRWKYRIIPSRRVVGPFVIYRWLMFKIATPTHKLWL